MFLIFFFLTLFIFVSYPVVGYKIFKAFRNKNKRRFYKLSILLMALIMLPGFIWRVLPGSDFLWQPIDKFEERSHNLELTGFKFNDGKSIYIYQSKRSFNGDGYSIRINEIDENTRKYFKNPNEDFFTKHPITNFRNDWKSEFWKRTPFDENDQKFLHFAQKKLDELDFELEDLLNEKGNYYAFEYYMHEFGDGTTYVGNIDFVIICPYRKIIVRINHNT